MLRQLVKKEQMMRIFSSSYDSAVMKRVLATHAPDGRQVDLEPLLAAIEETFRHAVLADFDSVIIITAVYMHDYLFYFFLLFSQCLPYIYLFAL